MMGIAQKAVDSCVMIKSKMLQDPDRGKHGRGLLALYQLSKYLFVALMQVTTLCTRR